MNGPVPGPRVLVTGTGGFIGHHLVIFLRKLGFWVRGMGFISAYHAAILRLDALIKVHAIEAARHSGLARHLFSSWARIYPQLIIEISGRPGISVRHVDGPQGMRARSSDNRRLREVLDWEPGIALETGLPATYR